MPNASIIYYSIYSDAYDTSKGIGIVKALYGKQINLSSPLEKRLQNVTVVGHRKAITLAPNEIKINWNKYMKDGASPLSKTIESLPFVVNNSLNQNNLLLETVGKKKVKVFLDGRELSDAEVLSLPSMSIAKASLVTFPSAGETDGNSAILYLTTLNYAYSYHFQEITGGYDVGVSGPSLTYRNTKKNGAWSSNVFLNAYHYDFPNMYTARSYENIVFQKDTTKSKSTTVIFSASATKVGRKGNLLTFGLASNILLSNSDVYSFSLDDGSLYTNTKFRYFNVSAFMNYQWTTTNGNKLRLSTLVEINPNNHNSLKSESIVTNLLSSNRQTNYSENISLKYTTKSKNWGDWKWSQSFNSGLRFKQNSIQRSIDGENAASKNILNESSFFAGYNVALTNEKYSLEFSIVGNLSTINGYSVPNYQHGYVYPKLTAGYAIDDNNSLTLSFSNPTYRPNLSSLASDSNYNSNWLIVRGDDQLKTEKEYNMDVLLTSTLGKNASLEASYMGSYFQDGIVTSYSKDEQSGYTFYTSWLNCDYWLHSLSFNLNYDLSNSFSIRSNTKVSYIAYRDQSLYPNYKSGFFFDGDLRANYTIGKVGDLSLLANWNPLNRSYVVQKREKVYLDFSYSKSISKAISVYFAVYDLLGTKGNRATNYQNRLYAHQMQNNRSVSLSITWKLGQMFGVRNAGSGGSEEIPSDTKK